MEFLNSLLPRIEALGYVAYWVILLVTILESTAFIGLIIPGTTVLIFVGFLAAQGGLDFQKLVWFVTVGGIIGDAISFYLGRLGLEKLKISKRLLSRAHVAKGEEFFKKHGEKSVVLARFIGPLRPIIPFIAGLFKMRSGKFFLYNIVSGFLSAIIYLSLGYFFGNVWGSIHRTIRQFEVPAIIILISVAMGYIWKKELFK